MLLLIVSSAILLVTFPSVNSECRQLSAPTNGYVDNCNTKTLCKLGSTAKFWCGKGYKVQGPASTKCTAVDNSVLKLIVNNAPIHTWTNAEPSCVVDETHCAPIKDLANGKVNSTCAVGKVCPLGTTTAFKCNEGFTLSGATAILCQKVSATSSQWSSSAPFCNVPGSGTSALDNLGVGTNSLQALLGLLLTGKK